MPPDAPAPVTPPLHGITVVDVSHALAGPYASLMFADAGARVIKVESPRGGDTSRGWGPPFVEQGPARESTYFLSVNRSKLSVTLDLRTEEGLAAFKRLLVTADVLVENFRPGTLDKMGLDESGLEALNPSLIVLSITGFDPTSADADRSGFDQIIQGEAGLMSVTGAADGEPTRFGIPITDIVAGMFGAFGAMVALRDRDAGQTNGQRVSTSLFASAVALHTYQGTAWTVGGRHPRRTGNHHPSIAPYGSFRCSDGHVNLAVGTESLWQTFAAELGIEPDHPDFATNADRCVNGVELSARIEAVLATRDCESWVQRFLDLGVPVGRIRRIDEVYDQEGRDRSGASTTVHHPHLGPLRLPASPLRYSRSQLSEPFHPPALGEHNDLLGAAEHQSTGGGGIHA